jgi:hypothetical protein
MVSGLGRALGWSDLTEEEQTALKRTNRGPYQALSKVLAERLISSGLPKSDRAGQA